MKNSGQFDPEWLDIQSLIIYLTGAVNRVIVPPSLIILVPALSMDIAEDHSGGGFTDSGSLSIPGPGITSYNRSTHRRWAGNYTGLKHTGSHNRCNSSTGLWGEEGTWKYYTNLKNENINS
jgi:hypothetical protein